MFEDKEKRRPIRTARKITTYTREVISANIWKWKRAPSVTEGGETVMVAAPISALRIREARHRSAQLNSSLARWF
jgi:hypothetical protein